MAELARDFTHGMTLTVAGREPVAGRLCPLQCASGGPACVVSGIDEVGILKWTLESDTQERPLPAFQAHYLCAWCHT